MGQELELFRTGRKGGHEKAPPTLIVNDVVVQGSPLWAMTSVLYRPCARGIAAKPAGPPPVKPPWNRNCRYSSGTGEASLRHHSDRHQDHPYLGYDCG